MASTIATQNADAGSIEASVISVSLWKTVMPPHVRARLGMYFTELELEQICEKLALPPRCTSLRVNTMACTREDLIAQLQAELDKMDQGHMYGEISAHPQVPDAILISPKDKSARTIEGNDREIVVSRRCAESVLRGSNIFVPGIMGSSPWVKKGEEVTVLCDVHDRLLHGVSTHILSTGKLDPKRLKGMAMRGVDMSTTENQRQFRVNSERMPVKFGEHTESSSGSTPLPDGIIIIARGIAQLDRKDMFQEKEGVGVVVTDCVFTAPPLNGLFPGKMYVQNLPSMVVAHQLAPQDGERILDMCASPGGKSTHIAALMHGTGEVISIDRTQVKVDIIKQWARDLQLPNVKAFKGDATALLPLEYVQGEKDALNEHTRDEQALNQGNQEEQAASKPKKQGKKKTKNQDLEAANQKASNRLHFEEESFDRVLLDPPCTALGLRPRLLVDLSENDIEGTPGYQRLMMHVAVRLLKPGGRLVFSTCTLNVAENEQNVAWALSTFPLRLLDASPRVGAPGRAGAGLSEEDRHKVQRFGPGTDLDTNGFFISAFEKTASTRGV